MATEGSGGVQSVHLAIDVLEAVAFSDDELGVTQIAERLKVTKGSVHRHLTTLVERGYLAQNPATTRYTIGPKSRLLARLSPDTDLVKVAEGPMRELRDALGQTVVLSEMTPRGAMVLVTIPGTSPIEIGVRPGSELPFYNSAQGKVLLAYAPRPFQMRVLRGPFEKVTVKTVVAPDRLDKSLQEIIKRGYGAAPEESMLGINAVAVPIFDSNDACVAALAVVGSIQYLPEKAKPGDIAALMHAAEQISRKLGHDSGTPFAQGRHRSISGR
ncbi:MAG: IclR family transcriptional regulator [Proteobacteria bacterium]|nr:IclR family transcriptional regulator [Pseudomonadota bacterium]